MIIAAALGMVAGILLGLLPGIGATTVMLALIPVLSQTDIIFVFAFYFAMLTTANILAASLPSHMAIPGRYPACRLSHTVMP